MLYMPYAQPNLCDKIIVPILNEDLVADGEGAAMLNCYFDDSGTHDASRVVVWGCVGGDERFFSDFDKEWRACLADPCDGEKPPISAFHSSHLDLARGEFTGYTRAESDRVRRNFREVIKSSGLTIASFAISNDAWQRVEVDLPRDHGFSAESFVFGALFRFVCHSAKQDNDSISMYFDQGRVEQIAPIAQIVVDSGEFNPKAVGYGFWPVKSLCGLQAADMVAHETYGYFKEYADDETTEPSPHLKRLIESAFDSTFGWFGDEQLRWAIEHSEDVVAPSG